MLLAYSLHSEDTQQVKTEEPHEQVHTEDFDDFGFDLGLPDEHTLEKGSAYIKFLEDKAKNASVAVIVGMINAVQWCQAVAKKWTSREK